MLYSKKPEGEESNVAHVLKRYIYTIATSSLPIAITFNQHNNVTRIPKFPQI